jgi:hypothetical protein
MSKLVLTTKIMGTKFSLYNQVSMYIRISVFPIYYVTIRLENLCTMKDFIFLYVSMWRLFKSEFSKEIIQAIIPKN